MIIFQMKSKRLKPLVILERTWLSPIKANESGHFSCRSFHLSIYIMPKTTVKTAFYLHVVSVCEKQHAK